MRTLASVAVVVVLGAGPARAQPGQTPPGPYAPAPAPAPYVPVAPGPYAPSPYGYQPVAPVQLSVEDRELLAEGEISDGAHLGGGLAAVFLGFGTGQAIQGRWSDKGWIFTVGDAAAISLFFYGLSKNDCLFAWDCTDADGDYGETEIVVALLGGAAIRVWEIADAFVGPSSHNRRVRELRARLGVPMYGVTPFVVPAHAGDGAVAGVSLRF